MKHPIIISGFPLVGKTYVFENQDKTPFSITDSDSSSFSWTKDSDGNRVRNSEFPQNYIDHLKGLIAEGKYDVILVSSHNQVQQAMLDNDINFYCVYPEDSETTKQLWLEKFDNREYNGFTREFLDENYSKFIQEGDNFCFDNGITMFHLRAENITNLFDMIPSIAYTHVESFRYMWKVLDMIKRVSN